MQDVFSKAIGATGERDVNRELAFLSPANYKWLHNLEIPDKLGSTQVDHVVISLYGIFVIETKNYSGKIYGNAADSQWTACYGTESHRFQNPLRQNFRHTHALADFLQIDHNYVQTIICFTGSAEVVGILPEHVLVIDDLCAYVKRFTKQVLSKVEMMQIYTELHANCRS